MAGAPGRADPAHHEQLHHPEHVRQGRHQPGQAQGGDPLGGDRNQDDVRQEVIAMSEAELRQLKARIDDRASLEKKLQILLALGYRDRLRAGQAALPLSEVEFRTFSQNGEDGILQYIFAVIGTHSRRAVEICAGDGIECNTANLIINHGWRGLLVDGQKDLVRKGTRLYAMLADTFIRPPTFVHAWITADNVNQVIQGSGFAGELDLSSPDLRGR